LSVKAASESRISSTIRSTRLLAKPGCLKESPCSIPAPWCGVRKLWIFILLPHCSGISVRRIPLSNGRWSGMLRSAGNFAENRNPALRDDGDFRLLTDEFEALVQRVGDEDTVLAIDAQDEANVHFPGHRAPAVRAGDEDRLGGGVGQGAGPGAGRDQHGDRLRVVGRVAVARVEQVGVALAVEFEVALVVAGGTDRFAVGQRHRGHRPRLARVLDADAPWFSLFAAERHDVAADVDQRVVDALLPEDGGGAAEGDALQVAAEIEGDIAVAAADGVAGDGEVGNRRLGREPGLDLGRWRQFGLEFVGLEALVLDQPADAGVEQVVALFGQRLRLADEVGQFRFDFQRPAVGDGGVQRGQFGVLPGMVGAVQAVEFAQHGGDGLAARFGIVADDQHFDAGAEDVGLLLLQRRATAGGETENEGGEDQVAEHACSRAVMKAPAASKLDCWRISTMQGGLVTLISVSWSPMTSRPTSSSPRLNSTGPRASAISRSRADSSWATPVPPAARLPRVSPALGMRARQKGTGWPAISRMRLSPRLISGTKRCAMIVRVPSRVSVSTMTLRFGSLRWTRKTWLPPMPSSGLRMTSRSSSMKRWICPIWRNATVGGEKRANSAIASFSECSRSARGRLQTLTPSASARSSSQVAVRYSKSKGGSLRMITASKAVSGSHSRPVSRYQSWSSGRRWRCSASPQMPPSSCFSKCSCWATPATSPRRPRGPSVPVRWRRPGRPAGRRRHRRRSGWAGHQDCCSRSRAGCSRSRRNARLPGSAPRRLPGLP